MDNILNPSALVEKVVTDNTELLGNLEKDKEYQNWFQAMGQSGTAMPNIVQDYLSMLIQDEYLPGEQRENEFAFLNNLLQYPFSTRLLRNAGRTEAPRLIKNKRRLQLLEFAKPSFSSNEMGFGVRFADKDYKPSEIEKQNLREFTHKIVDKFFFPPMAEKADLGEYLGICYDDFFDLDDMSEEIRRTATGKPLGLHIVDPTLIYHIIPRHRKYDRWDSKDDYVIGGKAKDISKEYKYLLMKNNRRRAAYTSQMMMKHHFFTSSDYTLSFRGYSIMEQGIRMAMNIVNSLTYNASNFNNNRTPMGVFAVPGGQTNRVMLEQFKKILYSYLSGANNRYRLPVIGLPEKGDAKFIPFSSNSREMEFHLWITLLFTVLCQLSGTNPEEISMSSHESAMTGKKLFDAAPDGILQVSRDSGLNSFLRYREKCINKSNVLKEMTGYNIVCEFNGLVVEDERVKTEVMKSQLSSIKSYNDVIVEKGGPPQTLLFGGENIYDVKGIDSPMIMQVLQAKEQTIQQNAQIQQQQQQQQQGALNGESPDLTDKDQSLIAKKGAPEKAA